MGTEDAEQQLREARALGDQAAYDAALEQLVDPDAEDFRRRPFRTWLTKRRQFRARKGTLPR